MQKQMTFVPLYPPGTTQGRVKCAGDPAFPFSVKIWLLWHLPINVESNCAFELTLMALKGWARSPVPFIGTCSPCKYWKCCGDGACSAPLRALCEETAAVNSGLDYLGLSAQPLLLSGWLHSVHWGFREVMKRKNFS